MPYAQHLEVFVVDDTSVSRALICNALDEIGLRNRRMAKDGEEALKALMAKPAHLVISDMEMPKLDGLALLKALREYKPTSGIGFIMVTGRNDKSILERGRALRLNNFLIKPYTAQSLRACIEAVTGKLV